MRARTRAACQKYNVGLIIVDYLQLLTVPGNANLTEKTTEKANAAKALAQDFRVPVLALSQLSRELEKDGNRKPRLSDLRESGAIEQAANIVMFLHSLPYSEADEQAGCLAPVDLLVEANRNGPTGRVPLQWHKPLFRFLPKAYSQPTPPAQPQQRRYDP